MKKKTGSTDAVRILITHSSIQRLGEMSGDQLGHFKHRHFCLASKYCFQVLIRKDVTLVVWILQVMLLDIDPERLYYL